MELTDFIPAEQSFVVCPNGREIELFFRPRTLRDEARIKSKYTAEGLEKAFINFDSDIICGLAFSQLTDASKKELFSLDFVEVDDETGKDVDLILNGKDRLANVISSPMEIKNMLTSLIASFGVSKEFIADKTQEEKEKKK